MIKSRAQLQTNELLETVDAQMKRHDADISILKEETADAVREGGEKVLAEKNRSSMALKEANEVKESIEAEAAMNLE